MSNYSLELEFLTHEGGDIPFPPLARIYVASSSRDEKSNHEHYISLNCLSATELNSEIDRLIAELENIRSRGRKKFTEHV